MKAKDLFYALAVKPAKTPPADDAAVTMDNHAYGEHMRRALLMPEAARAFFANHDMAKRPLYYAFERSVEEAHRMHVTRLYAALPLVMLPSTAVLPWQTASALIAFGGAVAALQIRGAVQQLRDISGREFHQLANPAPQG